MNLVRLIDSTEHRTKAAVVCSGLLAAIIRNGAQFSLLTARPRGYTKYDVLK